VAGGSGRVVDERQVDVAEEVVTACAAVNGNPREPGRFAPTSAL
jgi:hypothetical protein